MLYMRNAIIEWCNGCQYFSFLTLEIMEEFCLKKINICDKCGRYDYADKFIKNGKCDHYEKGGVIFPHYTQCYNLTEEEKNERFEYKEQQQKIHNKLRKEGKIE